MRLIDIAKKDKAIILYDSDFFICNLKDIADNMIPAPAFNNTIRYADASLDSCAVKHIPTDDVRNEFESDITLTTIDGVEVYESFMSLYTDHTKELDAFLITAKPVPGEVIELIHDGDMLKIILPSSWE